MYVMKANYINRQDKIFSLLKDFLNINPELLSIGNTVIDCDFIGIIYESGLDSERYCIIFDVYTRYIHSSEGTTFNSIINGSYFSDVRIYEVDDTKRSLMLKLVVKLEEMRKGYANHTLLERNDTIFPMYRSFLNCLIGKGDICEEYIVMEKIIESLPEVSDPIVYRLETYRNFIYDDMMEYNHTKERPLNKLFDNLKVVVDAESNVGSEFMLSLIKRDNIDIVRHSIALINIKALIFNLIKQEEDSEPLTLNFNTLIRNINVCLNTLSFDGIDYPTNSNMLNIVTRDDKYYDYGNGEFSIRIPESGSNISFLSKEISLDLLLILEEEDKFHELQMKLSDHISTLS